MRKDQKTALTVDRLCELLHVDSDGELSEKLEIARTTVSSWRQRGYVPLQAASEIATRFGLELSELVGFKPTSEEVAPASSPFAPGETKADLVFVEFWNQPVEGGSGAAEVEQERVVRHLAFNRMWLAGASPSQSIASVKAVRVRKNSMAPDIQDGDVILVDIASRTPVSGQVYVIRRGVGGLVVKELRKEGGRWIAVSRNPEDREKAFPVKPEEDGGDVIRGRVFWRCGRV